MNRMAAQNDLATGVFRELGELGVVPVIKLEREEDAVPLGTALLAGGLPCAEITFRTAAAPGAIRRLVEACPDVLVGAGTVLSVAQAEQALAAGARFIVSPGFSPAVVQWCQAQRVLVLPGTVTPSEIMAALEAGIHVVKFFPAEAYGGIATIKALSAPFADVRFMPTGGVNAANLADYLSVPAVLAVGGSWMVESKLLAARQYDEVARLAAEARAIVRRVRNS